MITMASSYHFGFNCGFNVAESLNFVNPSLLDLYLRYGREAKPCVCRPGAVRIDLDVFEEYDGMNDEEAEGLLLEVTFPLLTRGHAI